MDVKVQDQKGPPPQGTVPAPPAGAPRTLPDLLEAMAAAHGPRVFLPRRNRHGGEPVSFATLARDARALARALLDLGLRRGDRVGLLADNRYEWLLADLATTYLGAVDVPRGSDTPPAEVHFILRHAGCRMAFVDGDAAAKDLLAHRPELPELETVLSLAEHSALPGVRTLPELLARGAELLASDPEPLVAARAAVRPQDLLTLVYTSGTTADPKGVMLTHGNILSNIEMVHDVLHVDEHDVFLSVLPAWHTYERIMDYVALSAGAHVVYTDRRRIKEDLVAVRPTAFAAVPRIWEMIHDGILHTVEKMRGVRGRLLRYTLHCCRRVGAGRPRLLDRLAHPLLRATILPKVLASTGGRLRLAVSGGGSLPAHVDETLLGLGLPILNGYGLTETSPVASVRVPEDNRPGTIGRALPRTEIQIRDEAGRVLAPGQIGLIWIRGPQVMAGYYRNPERTAQVMDAAGWFNSGDLGCIEPDSHLRITGRAKDTIVLAGGENVEPEPIEVALKASPLIDQAIVVGQDQKHVGALLVVNPTVLELRVPQSQWQVRDGLIGAPAVLDLYRQEIHRLVSRSAGFRPVDRIATFRLLAEPMSVENGALTQTLKVKRRVVAERYAGLLGEMFAG